MAAALAGARYGVKIRLPHAAVMTFLFRRDLNVRQKLTAIWRATVEHARRLGSFALIYKAMLVLGKAAASSQAHYYYT